MKLPPTKVHSKSKQRWQRCKAGWVSSYDSIVKKRYYGTPCLRQTSTLVVALFQSLCQNMTLHLKTWVVTPGLLQPLSTEGARFSWSVMCHSCRPRDEEHTISLLASIHLPQAMQDLRRCAPACSHPVCFSCDSCSTCTFACNCVEPKELPRWRESMRVKTQICAIESGKI